MPPKQIEKGKERLQIQGPTTPQITTPPHIQIQITTPRSIHRTVGLSGYKNRVGNLKATTFARLSKVLKNGKLTHAEYNSLKKKT